MSEPLVTYVNIDVALKHIYEQREEILHAFIAKYGFEPDEAMQVQQGAKWWVEKRIPDMTAKELRVAAKALRAVHGPNSDKLADRFEYYAKRFDPILQTPST